MKIINVMYSDSNDAERNIEIKNIIKLWIIQNNLKLNDIKFNFININQSNLYFILYQNYLKSKLFISAFGSTDCKNLNDLFFIKITDAIHLNSYSTAPSLKNKNLIRYIASDNNLQDIITKEISLQSGNVVIIKSTINNIYSDDYIDVIKKAVPDKKIFIINENEFELNKIFNNNVGNNITIYFIIENPIKYYQKIFNFNPKTNFSIIGSDIVSRDLTNDINLLNYLNNKNTRVIYQLISEKEIELSKLYNKFINNSKTPTTSLLYNTLVILDIALLMIDTINIIDRDYYTDISLNEFNDHSKIVYGIFNYDFNSFKLNKLYNIVNNILF